MPAALAKLCVASAVVASCMAAEPRRLGSWEPIADAPEATAVRGFDAADFADGKLFVWGDSYSRGFLYDVATDAWREASAVGRPPPLLGASALWANGRVLLWGQGQGAIYDPNTDQWTPMARENAPAPRIQHSAVWTGTRMLLWGGAAGPDPLKGYRIDGALYDPAADAWVPIPIANAPSPRARATTVWTGTAMIVWGGQDANAEPLGDGAMFNPATNAWTPLPVNVDSPKARFSHSAVWTGKEMFVWSGICAEDHCSDGSAYDPAANAWRTLSPRDAATKRSSAAAVWSGAEVLLWSGVDSSDGYRWEPIRDAWTRMAVAGAPSRRGNAFAFWTGDRMLLWGGSDLSTRGAFYRP